MKKLQIDLNDVIDALSMQVANLSKENAILKAQINSMTSNKEETKNAK